MSELLTTQHNISLSHTQSRQIVKSTNDIKTPSHGYRLLLLAGYFTFRKLKQYKTQINCHQFLTQKQKHSIIGAYEQGSST